MSKIITSVIIPFYNNVSWLIEAVESVLNQDVLDYEIIVINDGSKEDMSLFLQKYESKIIYKWKENGGPASARNCGIQIAKGEYIAFLDSDDLWYKSKLRLQVDFMRNTGAIWSHTNYALFKDYSTKKVYRIINTDYFNGIVFPRCLASTPVATSSVMIKAKFLRDNPTLRFNEEMRFGQDWYLWINIAIREPIFALSDVLTKFRIRKGNAALQAKIQITAKAKIWRFMLNNKDIFFGKDKVNYLLKIPYKMCFLGDIIIEKTEKNITKNKFSLEWLSKILYFLPYLFFKFLNRFVYK